MPPKKSENEIADVPEGNEEESLDVKEKDCTIE